MIHNLRKGFTLIELLIVVALLGALAVALIATVDPFEQLKKGTDTATRNTATELYKALIQYYTTKGSFPWATDVVGVKATDTAISSHINSVVSLGELKTNFQALASTPLTKIFLTSTLDGSGNRQNIAVCYLPESKSFRNEANAKYASSGQATAGTPGCLATNAAGTACYWCVQ